MKTQSFDEIRAELYQKLKSQQNPQVIQEIAMPGIAANINPDAAINNGVIKAELKRKA